MRAWLPSAITLCGALAAVLSLLWAAERPYWACNALIAAALCDMLDGRVARALNAQSAFGEQLDSLVDVIAFGVAPAFLAFSWRLSQLGSAAGIPLAALPCTLFVACSAVRLARFNSRPDADPGMFQGIPTPVAALLVVTSIMSWHELELAPTGDPRFLVGVLLATSALMVLPVPFRSFKHFRSRWARTTFAVRRSMPATWPIATHQQSRSCGAPCRWRRPSICRPAT